MGSREGPVTLPVMLASCTCGIAEASSKKQKDSDESQRFHTRLTAGTSPN